MAHSRSAKKRVRQNEDRRMRNKAVKSDMRTQIKRVRSAIAEKDSPRAQKELAEAIKRLDKAAQKKVIHPNEAARRKSRLQKEANEITE